MNVDECIFIIIYSRALRREQGRVVTRNILGQGVNIEVNIRRPGISVVLSCLTKLKFFLLKCFIGQFRRGVAIVVDVYFVILFHFFMVWNKGC